MHRVDAHIALGRGEEERRVTPAVVDVVRNNGVWPCYIRPIILRGYGEAGVNPFNKRYTVGFDASAKIKRTEFGVSTLAPLISDDVDIIISAAFERQS